MTERVKMTQKQAKKSGSKTTRKSAAKQTRKRSTTRTAAPADLADEIPDEQTRQAFIDSGRQVAHAPIPPHLQQEILARLAERYQTRVDQTPHPLIFTTDEVSRRMEPTDSQALGEMIDQTSVLLSELVYNLPIARQDLVVLQTLHMSRESLEQYLGQVEHVVSRLVELRNAMATYRA
jgi:hypothetical protein